MLVPRHISDSLENNDASNIDNLLKPFFCFGGWQSQESKTLLKFLMISIYISRFNCFCSESGPNRAADIYHTKISRSAMQSFFHLGYQKQVMFSRVFYLHGQTNASETSQYKELRRLGGKGISNFGACKSKKKTII